MSRNKPNEGAKGRQSGPAREADRELDQAELMTLETPLASPLNLRIRYRTPGSGMDLVPFLDLLFIGMLVFLLGSRVVFTPGIVVDLPRATESSLASIPVTEVLTVSERGGNRMFFFRDGIYDMESLKVFVGSQHGKMKDRDMVLLLKMGGNQSLQLQTELVSMAKAMGYVRVHVAVDPLDYESPRVR